MAESLLTIRSMRERLPASAYEFEVGRAADEDWHASRNCHHMLTVAKAPIP
jgi:hypothetical protein